MPTSAALKPSGDERNDGVVTLPLGITFKKSEQLLVPIMAASRMNIYSFFIFRCLGFVYGMYCQNVVMRDSENWRAIGKPLMHVLYELRLLFWSGVHVYRLSPMNVIEAFCMPMRLISLCGI